VVDIAADDILAAARRPRMPIDPRDTDDCPGPPARRGISSMRSRAAFASVWAVACTIACDDPSATGRAAHEVPAEAVPADRAATPSAAPAPVASDPWAELLARRVLEDGRLGRGSELVALDTLAAADAKPDCAACSLGKTTKLVVAASLDDGSETLRDLDAIHRFYADNGLGGVLVLAPREGDRLITPPDPRDAISRALALRDRLRLAMAVHVPARVDDGGNRVWDEYYAVGRSPMVLLVGPDDRVLFSAAAPPDWAALDRAIVDALAADGHAPVAKSPVQ
jgi:hypothetical protein